MSTSERLIILILFSLISSGVQAQEKTDLKTGRLYGSVHAGGFISKSNDLNNSYGDGPKFIYGASAGFPVSHTSHLIVRVNRLKLDGNETKYHYRLDSESGEFVLDSTSVGEPSLYRQWTYHVGLKTSVHVRASFYISVSGGLVFTDTKERIKENPPSNENTKGFTGAFLGLGLERRFLNDSVSLFAEVEHTFTHQVITFFIEEFGGSYFNTGIRYYLPSPKR